MKKAGRSAGRGRGTLPTPKERKMASIKNVVLVHGGFVDGAGWGSVYKILKNGGYRGSILQNPTNSPPDDAPATPPLLATERKSTPLNSRHSQNSYSGFFFE